MLISVEQVEAIIRAVATEEGFTSKGVPYESAWGPKIVERCRQAAIPSGQVAEDVKELLLCVNSAHVACIAVPEQCDARRALDRLAAQAQSAENYRGMWIEAERGRNALLDERNALRKAREEAMADAAKYAQSSEVWRKRVEVAADALADVLPGEVGRLDLIARINELKRRRDGYGRDLNEHIRTGVEVAEILDGGRGFLGEGIVAGAKRVVAERDEAFARAERLSAAGRVLSDHVDKAPDWTMRDEFAKAAMHTVVIACKCEIDEGVLKFADVARRAYRLADAMIAARGDAVDGKAWETEVRKDAAEQMRAACLAEALDECATFGLGPAFREALRRAIEGATP